MEIGMGVTDEIVERDKGSRGCLIRGRFAGRNGGLLCDGVCFFWYRRLPGPLAADAGPSVPPHACHLGLSR
jgi:hypothetical protein